MKTTIRFALLPPYTGTGTEGTRHMTGFVRGVSQQKSEISVVSEFEIRLIRHPSRSLVNILYNKKSALQYRVGLV